MSPERKSHATSSLRFSPVTKLWSERETVVGRMPKPRAQREAERRSKPALGAAPDACRADGDGFERGFALSRVCARSPSVSRARCDPACYGGEGHRRHASCSQAATKHIRDCSESALASKVSCRHSKFSELNRALRKRPACSQTQPPQEPHRERHHCRCARKQALLMVLQGLHLVVGTFPQGVDVDLTLRSRSLSRCLSRSLALSLSRSQSRASLFSEPEIR